MCPKFCPGEMYLRICGYVLKIILVEQHEMINAKRDMEQQNLLFVKKEGFKLSLDANMPSLKKMNAA
jgi:hypothetical protein